MGLIDLFRHRKVSICVGKTIEFGKYVQTSKEKRTPIEWQVLSIKDGKALLIAAKCMFCSAYCDHHKVPESISWDSSTARQQCQLFYDAAFSDVDKKCLLPKIVDDIVEDYVFLLSQQEVEKYLPTALSRKAKPTEIAIASGARLGWTEDTKECTSWWLLPEGNEYPKAVFQNGEIQFHSRNVYHSDFTIRPSILVDTAKFI